MRKINVLNFGLLLTVVLFFVSCASEQEKKTSALIEKIKAEKENDLKNTNLSIAYIEACYKKYKAFKEELSDNNKDGKLSKKTVYKEAKKAIEAYHNNVDSLKSIYVAQFLEGDYHGGGTKYVRMSGWGLCAAGALEVDMSLHSKEISELYIATITGVGVRKEHFQIAMGPVDLLTDTLIKGSIFYKPEGLNDKQFFCKFEWTNRQFDLFSDLWQSKIKKKL